MALTRLLLGDHIGCQVHKQIREQTTILLNGGKTVKISSQEIYNVMDSSFNHGPAENWIYPFFKTLQIQISLLLTKPSDKDPHCFHSDIKYTLVTGMLLVNRIKIGEECST